ncbi:MAG: thioredoxin family protein [Promethearchaeota archaeon]
MTNIEELKNYGITLPEKYNQGIVVCDIYTNWCGPCKILSPILEKLEKEGLFKLIKVDLEENRPLGERFNIHAIPTLLFFENGELPKGTMEIEKQPILTDGKMVGNWGETIIRKVISKLNEI